MGQRRFSERLKLFVEIPRVMELEPETTAPKVTHDPGRHRCIEPNLAPHRRSFRRIDESDPQTALLGKPLEQQNFYLSTAFFRAA